MADVVVKDRIGRRRYIIVENKRILRRIIGDIRNEIDENAKIIHYDNRFAVLFCRHRFKERIIKFLNDRGIETYKTAGTIKKARRIMRKL